MATTPRTYYEILGVARNATAEDIHRAYRRLARRYHPDVSAEVDARTRFDEVSTAYEVLHDPERRSRYDRLSVRAHRGGPSSPRRAPAFASKPRARDVPRFLDDDLGPVPAAPGIAPLRLRLVLVWDVGRLSERLLFGR
jgi:DnaJ-class molecular chaperone